MKHHILPKLYLYMLVFHLNMLKSQGHLKVKLECKEIDIFVYCKYVCGLCAMWMIHLRLKGILVIIIISH